MRLTKGQLSSGSLKYYEVCPMEDDSRRDKNKYVPV